MRKKILKALVCGALSFSMLAGGIQVQAAAVEQTPNYKTVTEVFDWGPAVSKLVINLGAKVSAKDVDKDTFKVHVKKILADGALTWGEGWQKGQIVLADPTTRDLTAQGLEGDREVINAYTSDEFGNKADGGNFVTVEMKIAPTDSLSSTLNYDPKKFSNNWVNHEYTITLNKNLGKLQAKNFVIDNKKGNIRPIVDDWKFSHYIVGKEILSSERRTLAYAVYEPKSAGKHPLIVWLHGGGEGGNDSAVLPIMGNKATMLSQSPIQDYFGGAFVLAPQCPTAWMEGYTGWADGKPIYEDILMALIKDYVKSNPNVDASRIYVGGDSNGGYMTLCLARDYPDYFAAGFPVCEGLNDKLISTGDLQNISKTPLWFVAAKTDKTLPPDINSVPTVARLREINAPVHFSYFDKVLDTSGLYKKDDGTPHEYAGHWSWIYVFNNEVEESIGGKNVKLFEWLAQQKR